MIKINSNDKFFLEKHIKKVDEVLKNNDLEYLLDIIDDKIIECIQSGSNELAAKLQRIFDKLNPIQL